jgi:hypothetical protein
VMSLLSENAGSIPVARSRPLLWLQTLYSARSLESLIPSLS